MARSTPPKAKPPHPLCPPAGTHVSTFLSPRALRFFVLRHARRTIAHFNVTEHPTAQWVSQQLREAFPGTHPIPEYLIFDRDSIFGKDVVRTVKAFGPKPVRAGYRAPWQNGGAQRWVGSCQRELLDHVIPLSANHLRKLVANYVAYYGDRTHYSLGKDAPDHRPIEARPSAEVAVDGLPRVGGLHRRHAWKRRRSGPRRAIPMTLVFEGVDSAGKGGAIRRLTAAMDARSYRVISVAAPTEEERAHPYLWRFWRHLPRLGSTTIYDRSWYGRVLVERIEGFCARDEWRRAYAEINSFETSLTDSGIVLMKFWLTISAKEQLRRFRDRQATPYKQYKITEEDWRNRAKWDAYEAAAGDMIEQTSTSNAPWILVEAEDKCFARIKVIRTVVQRLRKELD